ncbi:MAG: hypothetical protein R3B45_08860 [Bdellovibrionota bacterium]
MKLQCLAKIINILFIVTIIVSCATNSQIGENLIPPIELPFIKNSPEECYFLDEFMPVPDKLVPGKTGSLGLRYYTYNLANYKDWDHKQITLSFYSVDDQCWYLFEEYYKATDRFEL